MSDSREGLNLQPHPSERIYFLRFLQIPSIKPLIDRNLVSRIEDQRNLVARATSGENSVDFEAANFFHRCLRANVAMARTLKELRGLIGRFEKNSPPLCVLKCMDGRVQGSKCDGYPPGTVEFLRTDGAIVDTEGSNHSFWRRLNELTSSAPEGSRVEPPLFIALAHRGGQGSGCAAHGEDDQKALATVASQAAAVREHMGQKLYAIHGMVNTDDMSETLVFPDSTVLSAAEIIREIWGEVGPDTVSPEVVFRKEFLDSPIPDAEVHPNTQGSTPRMAFSGAAAAYTDLRTGIAMQTYLLEKIGEIVTTRGTPNDIVDPKVLEVVMRQLRGVSGLPRSLWGPLAYQMTWNVAHALYQRRRVARMSEGERERHLEHDEKLIGYGEGFETLGRNDIILAKRGRGDIRESLTVAKVVMEKNREHHPEQKDRPILVHANVEITEDPSTLAALSSHILSELQTMVGDIKAVFGDRARVLTTYSHKDRKQFIPVQVTGSGSSAYSLANLTPYPVNVLQGVVTGAGFTPDALKKNEDDYASAMMLPLRGKH